jgi:3-hydroxyisobutyrate dehydrogenase
MRVGVAGLGLMGSGIAARLTRTDHTLFLYNRSKAKAERFSKIATIASSPKELADKCEFVIIAVTDFAAVLAILLGKDGIIKTDNVNLVVADVSTISPSQSEHCANILKQTAGIEMLSVPVMGGPTTAETGNLVPMVAGNKKAFEKTRQIIEMLGRTFYISEKHGAANAMKLALNLNIALIASAVSEGVMLVKGYGIDPAIFIEILNSTPFKTGLSERKGPQMVNGDFAPSFHLKNMLKDLELAASVAQILGISLPQTALAQQIYRAANNSGFSDKDYTAICAFLAKINGVEQLQ